MNFLMLRTNNQTAVQEQQSGKETRVEENNVSKAGTLEGLIADNALPQTPPSETCNAEGDVLGDENGKTAVSNGKNHFQVDSHIDVTEDDGLIIIPNSMVSFSLIFVYIV